eukprot:CAMPEP_0201552538 /NCGR_PEP_ID=MMETSP0173_2-20130828/16775_1 /ASSEMBLY_ACC=CAM_ASM_000268 /TAXON_ID=218659 /ORGANISM="Vexillifera sp., Strain DIVA3 564/2" /LENGTH=372 /DNA_ID=CAMNT_0047963039 /DNA_START=17 /DNA_END=1135 /DNA_ORIENTATION=-
MSWADSKEGATNWADSTFDEATSGSWADAPAPSEVEKQLSPAPQPTAVQEEEKNCHSDRQRSPVVQRRRSRSPVAQQRRRSRSPRGGRRGRGGRGGRGYDNSPVEIPSSPPFKAFVTNVAWTASEQDVREFFSGGEDEKVVQVGLPKFSDTGRSKGVAIVEFQDVNGLTDALQLTNTEFMGRMINVNVSRERGNNRRRGGGGRRGGGSFWGRRQRSRSPPRRQRRSPSPLGAAGEKKKSVDPFGGAKPVDTASIQEKKMQEYLKKQKSPPTKTATNQKPTRSNRTANKERSRFTSGWGSKDGSSKRTWNAPRTGRGGSRSSPKTTVQQQSNTTANDGSSKKQQRSPKRAPQQSSKPTATVAVNRFAALALDE